ncbi:hypothetical protein [Companilactobacillus ginsenosidimutans]|uniref:Uncharacterized protein n=1 Tax=Companilactobacillus ginsenosidimutans TaxID=1007676 RepID=A0A0H4QIX0_9LACO|nr:hypothetical protein [Companilactobacillus ginsenosidimutans]AKP66628.1 hypothetical protein ABM34_03030 [Companilactobacillus ginsenosidimutans]
MGLFGKNKKENDPSANDFTKISQEIKKSPAKLSEAQRLFKNDKSRRTQVTKLAKDKDDK